MDIDRDTQGGHLLAELLRNHRPVAIFGGVQILDLHGETPTSQGPPDRRGPRRLSAARAARDDHPRTRRSPEVNPGPPAAPATGAGSAATDRAGPDDPIDAGLITVQQSDAPKRTIQAQRGRTGWMRSSTVPAAGRGSSTRPVTSCGTPA